MDEDKNHPTWRVGWFLVLSELVLKMCCVTKMEISPTWVTLTHRQTEQPAVCLTILESEENTGCIYKVNKDQLCLLHTQVYLSADPFISEQSGTVQPPSGYS